MSLSYQIKVHSLMPEMTYRKAKPVAVVVRLKQSI